MRRFFIDAAGWIFFTLLGNWLLKKVPAKLTENAVTSWIDDRIAEFFGLSAPQLATVVDFLWAWGLPAILAILGIWLYHLTYERWGRSEQSIAPSEGASIVPSEGAMPNAVPIETRPPPSPVTGSGPQIQSPAGSPTPDPIRQIPPTDKERLDLALYEIFDTITKLAMPPYNEARYLPHNWEGKLMGVNERRAFLADMERIRADYVKFLQRMQDIVFKDYYYYRDELRDGVLSGGGYPSLHGDLDDLGNAIRALPNAPVALNTVRLIAPQIEQFSKKVHVTGTWLADTQEQIRKREMNSRKPRDDR